VTSKVVKRRSMLFNSKASASRTAVSNALISAVYDSLAIFDEFNSYNTAPLYDLYIARKHVS
jgi:hypothetical protein